MVLARRYASWAVPGRFVPGVETAFLSSALLAGIASLVTAVVLRPRRAVAPARELALAE